MKFYKKVIVLAVLLISTTYLMAEKPTIETMGLQLAHLQVEITKEKAALIQREVKLNEMKVKLYTITKEDKKQLKLKLAEIEASLAKDHLSLSQREVKLYEMKLALEKAR